MRIRLLQAAILLSVAIVCAEELGSGAPTHVDLKPMFLPGDGKASPPTPTETAPVRVSAALVKAADFPQVLLCFTNTGTKPAHIISTPDTLVSVTFNDDSGQPITTPPVPYYEPSASYTKDMWKDDVRAIRAIFHANSSGKPTAELNESAMVIPPQAQKWLVVKFGDRTREPIVKALSKAQTWQIPAALQVNVRFSLTDPSPAAWLYLSPELPLTVPKPQ